LKTSVLAHMGRLKVTCFSKTLDRSESAAG